MVSFQFPLLKALMTAFFISTHSYYKSDVSPADYNVSDPPALNSPEDCFQENVEHALDIEGKSIIILQVNLLFIKTQKTLEEDFALERAHTGLICVHFDCYLSS